MKRTALVIVALSLIAPSVAMQAGQASRPPVTTLTPQDYMQIDQLYARYAHGIDTGADNGNLLANVYTDDGFFANQAATIAEGHEALRQRWGVGNGMKQPTATGHWTWNVMVEPAPWGAIGRAYIGIARPSPDGRVAIGNGGMYLDTLVRTERGWRFKARHFIQDWPAPPTPAVPQTTTR